MNFFNLNGLGIGGSIISSYRPLVNYSWSSTYQAQEYKTDGVELVINGGFDTDLSGWTVTASGWYFDNGTARINSSDYTIIKEVFTPTLGDFLISLDMTFFGSDGLNDSGGLIIAARTYSGTYRELERTGLRAVSSLSREYFVSDGISSIEIWRENAALITNASIDNISVQKVIQEPNKMYSTNSGTGTDLQLYSGQGWKNNGVDQDLDLVDIGATSMIYTLDGVQTYTETPFYSFLGLGGVWNDIAYFNRALTQTEITKYSTNPNGFFNDALEDDTCVLNMPLSEHSDYCIDYANYSEGSELADSSFSIDSDGTQAYIQIPNVLPRPANTLVKIEFEIYDYVSGSCYIYSGSTSDTGDILIPRSENGVFTYVGEMAVANDIYFRSLPFVGKVRNVSVKQLTGIHRINPYTDSCRDEAKQLPYGSQNANYKINGLGMREEESPYFECSELFDNYGDTGWIPTFEDWTLEHSLDTETAVGSWYDGIGINFSIGLNSGMSPRVYINGTAYTDYSVDARNTEVDFVIRNNTATSETSIFINKILKATVSNAGFTNTLAYKIGTGFVTRNQQRTYYKFKVHPKALTDEEIQAL